MFRIGVFARLSGVSAKALRAYDERGLFSPAWVDPESDYRYYSPAQLPELRRILALRDLGFGLDQIGRLVNGRADLEATLRERRRELERDRSESARRLATLEITVAAALAGLPALDVVVRPLAEEPVATLELTGDIGQDIGAAFDRLEAFVRNLDRRAHRPPGAIVCPEAPTSRQSDLIFVPLTGPIRPADGVGYAVLPSVRAATVLVRGSYAGLTAASSQLHAWVDASGLQIADDLRVLYLQFGADARLAIPAGFVVESPADFLTEVQLPVEP